MIWCNHENEGCSLPRTGETGRIIEAAWTWRGSSRHGDFTSIVAGAWLDVERWSASPARQPCHHWLLCLGHGHCILAPHVLQRFVWMDPGPLWAMGDGRRAVERWRGGVGGHLIEYLYGTGSRQWWPSFHSSLGAHFRLSFFPSHTPSYPYNNISYTSKYRPKPACLKAPANLTSAPRRLTRKYGDSMARDGLIAAKLSHPRGPHTSSSKPPDADDQARP